MSSDVAIRVEGLGKAYRIKHQHNDHVTLAQVALDRVRHPLRKNMVEEFWAVQDVDFEVYKGEVLGVIGRNGAGKSTLLKLLTRITAPTAGRIDLWGRVGSLLEVGTGFHPELTGRENVYLNGSILGMTRKEIDRQFDAIVDFAGVERFLDTPVKRYSSGMYVRLAFAVAAHLETEILLVDEVLAVGDAEFQKKCLGKMHDVAVGGRTVLFVSHQMSSISQLCDRALVLDQGTLAFIGDVAHGEAVYVESIRTAATSTTRRQGSGGLEVHDATMAAEFVRPVDPKVLTFRVVPVDDINTPYFVSVHVVDAQNRVISQCDSRLLGVWLDPTVEQEIRVAIDEPWLVPGDYRVDIFVCAAGVIDAVEGACTFVVSADLPYAGGAIDEAMAAGLVLTNFTYEVAPSSNGPIEKPSSAIDVAGMGSTSDDDAAGAGSAGSTSVPSLTRDLSGPLER